MDAKIQNNRIPPYKVKSARVFEIPSFVSYVKVRGKAKI
jgi:hypothetical protein